MPIMKETCKIVASIMASLNMSIISLSSGTLNTRTQLRLQTLDWSCFAFITAIKEIEDLCYNLGCFGLPLDGLADVFCDNKSVAKKLSISTSVLNNINNYICYHRVKQAQYIFVILVGWIP